MPHQDCIHTRKAMYRAHATSPFIQSILFGWYFFIIKYVLEFEQVGHCKQSFVLGGVFGSKYCTQGESLAGMRIVGNGNAVSLALPGNGVDTGNLIAADTVYTQFIGRNLGCAFLASVGIGKHAELPTVQALHLGHKFLAKGNAGARGMVELVYMMHFLEHGSVGLKTIHDTCQITVYGTEDCYAKAEVGTPEQGLALLHAHLLHLLAMLGNPASTATDNLHSMLEGLHVVVVGRVRCGKLNGNVGTLECLAIKVLLVVNVYDADNLVTTPQGYFFYLYLGWFFSFLHRQNKKKKEVLFYCPTCKEVYSSNPGSETLCTTSRSSSETTIHACTLPT